MRRIGTLLVAFVLLSAACGSDDVEPAATDAPPATGAPDPTDAPPATDAPVQTDAPDPTDAPPATDPPTTGAPVQTDTPPATDPPASGAQADALGPIPSGDPGSAWCTVAAEVEAAFDELEVVDLNDPAALEPTYRRVRELIGEAQGFAPPELSEAIAVNIQAIDILIVQLDDVDWRFIDLDLSALSDIEQELSDSSDTIDRYNFYVCNIDNGYDPDAEPSDDDPAFGEEGTVRESLVADLVGQGLTAKQANCIAEGLDFSSIDPNDARSTFQACGVAPELLATLFG